MWYVLSVGGSDGGAMRTVALVLGMAAGCNGLEANPAAAGHGWFTLSTSLTDPDNCPDRYDTWAPEDGVWAVLARSPGVLHHDA
jgi:hypothetical protein